MPASDLELLNEAARRAGEIAVSFWGQDPEQWDKGSGAGPVTEADIAVNGMLREMLLSARPDYGWLSEESEDEPARLERENVFVIDPIDGTRAFIAGERSWAHALAVVRGGKVQAGLVHLPLLGKTFAAVRGGGARLNGRRLRVPARRALEGACVLSTRKSLRSGRWKDGPPPVRRHFRPSLAYRLALVAEGRFDAMLTLHPTWEWDVAAGSLIASEAGARVTDAAGLPLRFNNPEPCLDGLLAAPDGLHAALRERLSGAGGAPAAPA